MVLRLICNLEGLFMMSVPDPIIRYGTKLRGTAEKLLWRSLWASSGSVLQICSVLKCVFVRRLCVMQTLAEPRSFQFAAE